MPTEIGKISGDKASPFRLWYNDWVKDNARGAVLDVGKSKHWDYGFPTLDADADIHPDFVGNIERTDFPDESFDTALCNGMYEFVSDPQVMIYEVLRITKKGGTAIFGFVGKDYKPYKKSWRFYEGKERFPEDIERIEKDFGQEYHFIICKKK